MTHVLASASDWYGDTSSILRDRLIQVQGGPGDDGPGGPVVGISIAGTGDFRRVDFFVRQPGLLLPEEISQPFQFVRRRGTDQASAEQIGQPFVGRTRARR